MDEGRLILLINMRGLCYEKERRKSKISCPYVILKFCEAIEVRIRLTYCNIYNCFMCSWIFFCFFKSILIEFENLV